MERRTVSTSLQAVRRLVVTKQRLAGKLPARVTAKSVLSLVHDIAYVQWDPVSIVAPSHLLSLWARLGKFRPPLLEKLLWEEKGLFLYWTPAASLVLTEDYPLYDSVMRRFPESLSSSWGAQRTQARAFMARHADLAKGILRELRQGPRRLRDFKDHSRTKRNDGDWTPGSDVSLMLSYLLMSGKVMVVGHDGNQNLWGLTERFLPPGVDRTRLSAEEFERAAAQRAIRALGVASPAEINYYFVRGRYMNLKRVLAQLVEESTIHPVTIPGVVAKDPQYVHDSDLPTLESVATADWEPRMSLLPPFDNLICSTARTSRMFGFDYVREQFLPAAKRRYGTYVLPILWGERFIGRIDPRFDPTRRELLINAVHAEPHAPLDRSIASQVGEVIERLSRFLGANRVVYTPRVPERWKSVLR